MPATKEPSRARPKIDPPPHPDLERYAEVGDQVLWLAGGNLSSPPWPGLVTAVGMANALALNVAHARFNGFHLKEHVLHVADRHVKSDWNADGGWMHRPFTVALRRLFLATGLLRWELQANNEWRLEINPEFQMPAAPPPTPEAA